MKQGSQLHLVEHPPRGLPPPSSARSWSSAQPSTAWPSLALPLQVLTTNEYGTAQTNFLLLNCRCFSSALLLLTGLSRRQSSRQLLTLRFTIHEQIEICTIYARAHPVPQRQININIVPSLLKRSSPEKIKTCSTLQQAAAAGNLSLSTCDTCGSLSLYRTFRQHN